MANQIIKLSFEQNELQTIVKDGEVLFPANSLAGILGYANPRDAIGRHVDKEDVVKHDTLTNGGKQKVSYVNESGMYALIFGSTKDEAKRFKRWVTADVLPTIRKTGGYNNNQTTVEISFDELTYGGVTDYDLRRTLDNIIHEVAKCYVDREQAKTAVEKHIADVCKMPHHSWITKDRFGVALYALSQISLKAYTHKQVLKQIDNNAIECLESVVIKNPVIVYQGV